MPFVEVLLKVMVTTALQLWWVQLLASLLPLFQKLSSHGKIIRATAMQILH